jgi:P-type Mg2+ transporter
LNWRGLTADTAATIIAAWRRAFFRLRSSHHHRDPAIAQRLHDAAAADPEQLLQQLGTTHEGLTVENATARLRAYGPNLVAHEGQQTLFRELLGRAKNPLNFLLLTLAALSFFLGDQRAAAVIAVMVLLSVSLAFIQEHRSSNAAARLRAMVRTTATVLRRRPNAASGGQALEIPIEELVPGDVVRLSAGDLIPADLRVLAAKDLFLNEAALTGEAMPVEKSPAPVLRRPNGPTDLPNVCFMGSNVLSGAGTAVVVETGASTYFGELAGMVIRQRAPTSFDRGVTRFTWLMIRFMAVMVPSVFVINGMTKGDWLEALMFALAVAVGLTPEMLPMIVTVNLAKGAIAMSRKRVIVKRLNAIQNFGAMDILCTDKTGTLTQDKIILKHHFDLHGQESARVLEYAYLNSHFQSGLKNLLDVAVLEHVELREHLQLDHRFEKIDELPFDFSRRRMSVVLASEEGKHLLVCKGAVEEIFAACTQYALDRDVAPLDASHLVQMQGQTARLNSDGFRVIGVAYKEFAEPRPSYEVEDESGLTLLGFIAFLDPPKESAGVAIAALARSGVRVKILTGDNDIIARKICREVGVVDDDVLIGDDLDQLTDQELAQRLETVTLCAKVSPAQKARIIEALHLAGHVVGFLGDGINDGPALKSADVGVSVDTAVDIAKESADIILLEKSLIVLSEGVVEGRKIFGNIVKYIKMGASSNFGNMFSVLGASMFLPFLPMAPIQVLTNNLLYDFSQTTIPTDNVDDDYTAAPRHWDIGNITKFMLFLGPISSIFDYITYGTLLFVFGAWSNPPLFQTGWFVESLLTQTLVIHIIRTAKIPFLQSRASNSLILTTVVVAGVGALLPYSPLGPTLGFVSLPGSYWLAALGIILGYCVLANLVKTWFVRRWGL